MSSAPGRLQEDDVSLGESWQRAARALPDVDVTSQVTPEYCEYAHELWQRAPILEAADLEAPHAEEARNAPSQTPQSVAKPPGIFYPAETEHHVTHDSQQQSSYETSEPVARQGSKKTKRRNQLKYNKEQHRKSAGAGSVDELE